MMAQAAADIQTRPPLAAIAGNIGRHFRRADGTTLRDSPI